MALATILLLAGAAAAFAESPGAKPIETLTAFAAPLEGQKAARIEIYRWSTDEERGRLHTTFRESGPEKLLDALGSVREPAGRIWTPTSLSYDLYYARSNPAPEGGRRIILAANRPVSFQEMRNPSRRIRYQFTLIEIRLDRNGKGEGKLAPAAGVSWDKEAGDFGIANYNALPADLVHVISKKP